MKGTAARYTLNDPPALAGGWEGVALTQECCYNRDIFQWHAMCARLNAVMLQGNIHLSTY